MCRLARWPTLGILGLALLGGAARSGWAQEPSGFERFFHDRTMRIDYFHSGDATSERVTLDRVYVQGAWAGSLAGQVDPFDYGRYRAEVRDAATGELIFAQGFDSYFGEYRTTDPALAGVGRTCHESVLMPEPKGKVCFTLNVRERDNTMREFFRQEIEPAAVEVVRENLPSGAKVIEAHQSGDPHRKVDIAFLAEGYTAAEEPKFEQDLSRFVEFFFSEEPYRSRPEDFNLRGVFRPSAESGVDEPERGRWRSTGLNASFNALGLPRYLLTEDNRALRDLASVVPYDVLVIMVNHSRYGGGGIYNWYAAATVDNELTGNVFLHEFGHAFAGLADEYYASTVAYNDFYPPGVEPAAPNITALLDPAHLKWAHLVAPGTPLPTPWEKEAYEAFPARRAAQQRQGEQRVRALQTGGASEVEIQAAREENRHALEELDRKQLALLTEGPLATTVGAFEGAGYAAKGLYRPMLDCLMFRNTPGTRAYCLVCQDAIRQVIRYYCR
jgi:hypothetical protein